MTFRNERLKFNEAPAMFSSNFRTKLWATLPAIFVGFILLGCGGGSEPAFVDEPTVSLFGNSDSVKVPPDGLTTLAIVLDKPAPKSISVRLLALDDAEAFTIPTSVRVSSGQSFAVFQVEGRGITSLDTVRLQIAAGVGYAVGPPGPVQEVVLEIDDGTSPAVFLEGGNQSIAPGASASLSVQRTTAIGDATVNLFVTPDTTGFSEPSTLVIEEGSYEGLFNVELTEESVGSVGVVILPPDGYVLGDPSSVTVTVEE